LTPLGNIINEEKRSDHNIPIETENTMDDTDKETEIETETTDQTSKVMDLVTHEEKMDDTSIERKQEKYESGNKPERDREDGNETMHNKNAIQMETCEEAPKPPKKIRMDKDRNPPRERTRSKTRLGYNTIT
jgi:hypothetical protein